MNARKCVHAQKPYSCQAFAHESSKVEGKARILTYNQRKTTRFFIEAAYSKINYNSINRHVDIPPQYDQVIRNVLN